MTPRIDPQPDFARFRDVLEIRQAVKRPPLFDFHIHADQMSRVLGRPVESARDKIAFYRQAGYDYVQVTLAVPREELVQARQKAREEAGAATHGSALAVIDSLEQFRGRRWSWQAAVDGGYAAMADQFEHLCQVADALPEGMRILLHGADIFTSAWEMIGFTRFCLASHEEPQWVEAVMESLATAVLGAAERAVERVGDAVGATLYSDDIAYTHGLMLAPDFFRQHLFPSMRRWAEIGHRVGAPMIYHSDGRLYQVLDDLAELGVRGVQPLEPKSMDPLEIKQRWPNRFCLVGNIDLDLLARGTPEQVERHVRERIDRLNVGGAYMPGVSNTVPDYVRFENYIRMIETVYSYG